MTFGTIKYTVLILEKKWWIPLMTIGLAAVGFSLIMNIISSFL
jgi:hypothetical protein